MVNKDINGCVSCLQNSYDVFVKLYNTFLLSSKQIKHKFLG